MTTSYKRRRLLIPLVALVLGTLAVGEAQAAPEGGAAINDVMFCDGFAQERALVRMDNQPTTIGENANFVPLPGAAAAFAVAAGDTDQIIVTFSAEARLDGQNPIFDVPADALHLQVLLNGVPMAPLNDLVFTTYFGESNATQACQRVGEGNYVVTVEWALFDLDANDVLTGYLDDWALHVEINN